MRVLTTMKKIIILLGVLITITAARLTFAQVTEGIITYEVRVNMHKTLPPEREQLRNMIPEFRTSKMQLFFNANESLFKPLEEEPDDEEMAHNGGMQMRIRMPQNEVYLDHSTFRKILLREFAGKNFLIEDTLKITPWKLSDETRLILGYNCKSATFYNEESKQHITAWYTDQLRPFLGPDDFHSLPGAVLLVDINEGECVIAALSVDGRSPNKNELRIPAKGIKTTNAEFRKFVTEQTERMRANGANVIIRN